MVELSQKPVARCILQKLYSKSRSSPCKSRFSPCHMFRDTNFHKR
jgi:hypothetical protein